MLVVFITPFTKISDTSLTYLVPTMGFFQRRNLLMQSQKRSSVDINNSNSLGSLVCTEEEFADGSAIFNFEGSDEDMDLIVKTGMLSVVKDDLLDVADYLTPNFDVLDDDVKIRNYFFAVTVKRGLQTLLEETLGGKQLKLFE
jgi:hypothetical protein